MRSPEAAARQQATAAQQARQRAAAEATARQQAAPSTSTGLQLLYRQSYRRSPIYRGNILQYALGKRLAALGRRDEQRPICRDPRRFPGRR
jgi:hypothetical protein